MNKRVVFPNLDGLRFISFFTVFLFHFYKAGFQRIDDSTFRGVLEFLFINGEVGVNFFFVLSGFLITYLLLIEAEENRGISIRKFYYRRILRIWPLYFLCLFVGFIATPILKATFGLIPNETASPAHYIFFLANFDYIRNWPLIPDSLALIVLWSVSVEEQFYLVWPIILRLFFRKRFLFILLSIIVLTLIFRVSYIGENEVNRMYRDFHTFSVVGDMAIGALSAYLSRYSDRFLRFFALVTRWQVFVVYILIAIAFLFRQQIFNSSIGRLTERHFFAVLFAFVIVEQCFAHQSFYKMSKFSAISELGKYTYGLYCIHFAIISLVLSVYTRYFGQRIAIGESLILFVSSLVMSIFFAAVIYQFIEKPFLRMKDMKFKTI